MAVIPATQEAEAGESLETGGRGCSELRSCHCTPAGATECRRSVRVVGKATLEAEVGELHEPRRWRLQ